MKSVERAVSNTPKTQLIGNIMDETSILVWHKVWARVKKPVESALYIQITRRITHSMYDRFDSQGRRI